MKNFKTREDALKAANYLKDELAKTKAKIEEIDKKADDKLYPLYQQIQFNSEKMDVLNTFKDKMKLVDEDKKMLEKAAKIIDRSRRQKLRELKKFSRKFCKTLGMKLTDFEKFIDNVDISNIDLAELGLA